jgi:hypothetical protein
VICPVSSLLVISASRERSSGHSMGTQPTPAYAVRRIGSIGVNLNPKTAAS